MPSRFQLPARPQATIQGQEAGYDVARIFCIGRNYAAHAIEMGMDTREQPFYFTKFADSLVPGGGSIPYPPLTADLHYEGELVLAIGKPGACIPVAQALDYIFGYAAGLDMTRRDRQAEARDRGRPWDLGKNFSFSAPLGPIRTVEDAGHLSAGSIRLSVNGNLRQDGDVADMIWNPAEIIAYLSGFERLVPGDLIYTGTPAGVGAVVVGDRIDLVIEGLAPLKVDVKA